MVSKVVYKRFPGFTMIELMIGVLIISAGILANAKLQSLSVSTSHQSISKTMLSVRSESLAAMLLSNKDVWINLKTPVTFSTTPQTKIVGLPATPNHLCLNRNIICNNADVAAVDLQQWIDSSKAGLKGFSGSVECKTNIATTCQILIEWLEKNMSQKNSVRSANAETTFRHSFEITL